MTSLGLSSYDQAEVQMRVGENMKLAFERLVAPSVKLPKPAGIEPAEDRLNVAVVFTSGPATLAALQRAGSLADRLGARITLIVPQIVPYPLPLETPPVLIDFSEQRLQQIVADSPVEMAVQIHLCRDRAETLKVVLGRRSLVVIGGRRRWWRTGEQRLAQQLRRAGHEVIFTEME
jgi:hypothetical protein